MPKEFFDLLYKNMSILKGNYNLKKITKKKLTKEQKLEELFEKKLIKDLVVVWFMFQKKK